MDDEDDIAVRRALDEMQYGPTTSEARPHAQRGSSRPDIRRPPSGRRVILPPLEVGVSDEERERRRR